MNQGKWEVVKQEMVRENLLGISELRWPRMGEFNSDDHYIYHCGQESLRRNEVPLRVNERVWNAVLWCNLKNDKMISVHFQGKPFNILVISVYAPTTDAEEAEVDQFYEDLEDLLEWNAEFQRIARRDWEGFNGQYKEIEENNRNGKARDVFKKIENIKGTFHLKMGTIKDRNSKDLIEAEEIKNRWK